MFRQMLTNAMGNNAPELKDDDIDEYSILEEPTEKDGIDSETNSEEMDEMIFGQGYVKNQKRKRGADKTMMVSSESKKKKVPGGRKLTREQSFMIGSANMKYMEGDFEGAIAELTEIIKVAPMCTESYDTLATIYEAKDDLGKAIEFLHISAALKPSDFEGWLRLGTMARRMKDYKRACDWFKKATKVSPTNEEAQVLYAEMLQQLSKHEVAARVYVSLVQKNPRRLNLWIDAAICFHSCNRTQNAIQSLQQCINAAFESTTTDDDENYYSSGLHAVNMLADIYISLKKFTEASSLIEKYESVITKDGQSILPMDLTVTYGITCVYLNRPLKAEEMFQQLFKEDIVEYADLYADAANAYLDRGMHLPKVLEVFQQLLDAECSAKETALERLGDCYVRMNRVELAFTYYCKAFSAATSSSSLSTSLVLSTLKSCKKASKLQAGLDLFNKHVAAIVFKSEVTAASKKRANNNTSNSSITAEDDEASLVITEALSDDDVLSQSLQDNRARLCIIAEYVCVLSAFEDNHHTTAASIGMPILLAASQQPLNVFRVSQKQYALEPKPGTCSPSIEELFSTFVNNKNRSHYSIVTGKLCIEQLVAKSIGEDRLFRLLLAVLNTSSSSSSASITELCGLFLTKKLLTSPESWQACLLKAISIAMTAHNEAAAYELAWMATSKFPHTHNYWNLLNQVMNESRSRDFIKQKKFAAKSLETSTSSSDDSAIMSLLGNISLSTDPKLALGEYTLAFQRAPEDPVTSLCLAAGFLNIVMSRTNSNRHHSLMCAFSFLQKYKELRLKESENESNEWVLKSKALCKVEAAYNLGRGFHQLGIFHLAIESYAKVLSYFDKEVVEAPYHICNEAAYNLALIYQSSGSHELARYVIEKYNTIE